MKRTKLSFAVLAAASLAACSASPERESASTSDTTASNLTGTSCPKQAVGFGVSSVPTQPGQSVYLVGDVPELGAWDVSAALPCEPVFDTEQGGRFTYAWTSCGSRTVNVEGEFLLPGTTVHYKFIMRDEAGNVVWQPGPDRSYTVPIYADFCSGGFTSDTW